MKLFTGFTTQMHSIPRAFEAFKNKADQQILITVGGYLYYIYSCADHSWHKYSDAGNYKLDPRRYQEVTREELTEAMGGKFPEKETDFLRLCHPSELFIIDMLTILRADFPKYMDADNPAIWGMVQRFLIESDICYKSYFAVVRLFNLAVEHAAEHEEVREALKELSMQVLGRDIYNGEIRIVDGHDSSSYFWIMPVRVIDYSNTNDRDNVASMWINEISIEEMDVSYYLRPYLDQYYDDELEANRRRVEHQWQDENGELQTEYVKGFEWNLTHNFYTHDAIRRILSDIRDTMDALSSGRENEYTRQLKKHFKGYLYWTVDQGSEGKQIEEDSSVREEAEQAEIKRINDFYRRFIYRMEYMITVGAEKGYDLISFMGP